MKLIKLCILMALTFQSFQETTLLLFLRIFCIILADSHDMQQLSCHPPADTTV